MLCKIELPVTQPAALTIELWPSNAVPFLRAEATEIAELRCEPDVVIDAPGQSLAVVEVRAGGTARCRAGLGKEAIYAHRRAGGRPWRLLCVTRDTFAPRIQGLRIEGGRLTLGAPMPLTNAVGSYFEAAASLGHGVGWPSASEVRAAVRWLPWSWFGRLFEEAQAAASIAPHEANLREDVVAILRRRGVMRPEFHGFRSVPSPPLGWNVGALWRPQQGSLWSITARTSPWPAPRWLFGQARKRSGFQGFGVISAKGPAPWPKLQWFSTVARKRR